MIPLQLILKARLNHVPLKFNNKPHNKESGYTLIELMVVIIIIGVLAGVAVPIFLMQRQAAYDNYAKGFLPKASVQIEAAITLDPKGTEAEIATASKSKITALENAKYFSTALHMSKEGNQLCAWMPSGTKNDTSATAQMLVGDTLTAVDCSSWTPLTDSTVKTTSLKQTNNDPAPAPVVPVNPATPAPAFPWSILLGVLVTIIAGGGLIFGGAVAYRKQKSANRVRMSLEKNWAVLTARHESIRKSWAAYELDASKLLSYPMLADMREPVTMALYAALRAADAAMPSNLKKDVHEPANGSVYEAAVIKLENAFHLAETEAKRIKWSSFTADERKRLKKAQDLLNLATNAGATEAERQVAYKAMRKELDGLLVMPETTILSIESSMKLMIEA